MMNFPQGLLGGGQPSPFSLLGFQPFRPNFGAGLLGGNQFAASPFQRTPYQPQRFPAPNIQPAPAPAPAAQAPLPNGNFAALGLPGNQSYYDQIYGRGVTPKDVMYMMTAGS